MADVNNGDNHPTCYGDSGGELARLTMVITSDPAYAYQFLPISWLWNDCGDNAVSSRFGDSLFVSSDVYDPAGTVITQDVEFPSGYGLPSTCLSNSNIVRTLDFQNGGIDIINEPTCETGDLNLNGVYYEVSDLVLYSNYFIYGLSVFTINPPWQIYQSDINCDGISLSIADLVFLLRIIIGDVPSGPVPPSIGTDTCVLVQDQLAGTVSLDYTQTISAVSMIFDGEIAPEFDLPNHDALSNWDGFYTRLLIVPSLQMGTISPINSGLLFSYSGAGNLISADVTSDGQQTIPLAIEGSGAVACCQKRGDVDGSSTAGSLINVADITALVAYLFGDGSTPPCLEESNIDGLVAQGTMTDVSDLSYLVAYIFSGGPPPPPCP